MLYREIIAAISEIHIKQLNYTEWAEYKLLNVKTGVA